jgi:alpha-tubulin suppressor-like RCC1 family protein
LGDGTTDNRNTPAEVVGLTSGVTAIAVGSYHTCALVSGDGVKCWGYNAFGQLGDGTTVVRNTPTDVVGLTSGATAIAAGENHTCARVSVGGVKCWGANWSGQLGDGTIAVRNTPTDVVGLTSGVTAIAASGAHSCALVAGGGVKCWGGNGYGQLGDATTDDRSTPVDVVGLASGVTAIAAGERHTCTLGSGGGVKCWGYNGFGQLGDGTWDDRSMPADVVGLMSGATAITAGGAHTCALVGSGRPKCWGQDRYGQLGVGTSVIVLAPMDVVEFMPPTLALNYPNGQPGSFFTVTGWNFPINSQATLSINDQVITTTLAVNETGSFIVFLSTTSAEAGSYSVIASVNPSAAISFLLADNAPLRPQEGGGQVFIVPAGIAMTNLEYLPLVVR